MNRQPTLEGQLVLVRPLRGEDFDQLYSVAADPLLWEQHPEPERWREDVFRAYFDDHLASGGALAVVERATGTLIGATRYDNHDPDASEVEIGWTFLARLYWGGVYNADLKRVMLEHAFSQWRRSSFSSPRPTCVRGVRSRNSAQSRMVHAGGSWSTKFTGNTAPSRHLTITGCWRSSGQSPPYRYRVLQSRGYPVERLS